MKKTEKDSILPILPLRQRRGSHDQRWCVLCVCGYVFCPRLRQTTWTIILMPMLCSTKRCQCLPTAVGRTWCYQLGSSFFKYRDWVKYKTLDTHFFLLFVISLRYINMTLHTYKHTYVQIYLHTFYILTAYITVL